MNPAVFGVLACLAGVVLGAVVVWLVLKREPTPDLSAPAPGPTVPEGVAEVLAVLPTAAIVVGPHDEVLQATDLAKNLGLVRGTRVSVTPILETVRAVRRSGEVVAEDLDLERGSSRDTSVTLAVRTAPLADDLVLVLAEDQTAARRVEQTRRDFVANVSHELKTPIGAISLLAEAVEEAADDPPAVRRFAARMGMESARLTDLVSQIIDLSRIQADDPLAQPEVVDIDDVLSDAVDRCRVDAERHNVTLTIAGAKGLRVVGSLRQLSVAVGNLVENAVVYSEDQARVVVAAHELVRSDDDWIEITVSDNGLGIPAADLERIFERFYRVDYARSRANGGNGLGLAIVKHIAAAHNGEVAVWSQPGRGSTFTVRVPAHQHASPNESGTPQFVQSGTPQPVQSGTRQSAQSGTPQPVQSGTRQSAQSGTPQSGTGATGTTRPAKPGQAGAPPEPQNVVPLRSHSPIHRS